MNHCSLVYFKPVFSFGFPDLGDTVMSLPLYFQWGHKQLCCWSTGWVSTWCPPEHTLPGRKEKRRKSNLIQTRFKTVVLKYSQLFSHQLKQDIHSLLLTNRVKVIVHSTEIWRQERQFKRCGIFIKAINTVWATCSAFRVSSIKICCSFSLTKLMQNCSKPFLCRGK